MSAARDASPVDPQKPSTSADPSRRIQENLRIFTHFYPKGRQPLTLWEFCSSRKSNQSMKNEFGVARDALRRVLFFVLLKDYKSQLNDIANLCGTSFKEICVNLSHYSKLQVLPNFAKAPEAEMLFRHICMCIKFVNNDWHLYMDKTNILDPVCLDILKTTRENPTQQGSIDLESLQQEYTPKTKVEPVLPAILPWIAGKKKSIHNAQTRLKEKEEVPTLSWIAPWKPFDLLEDKNLSAVQNFTLTKTDIKYAHDFEIKLATIRKNNASVRTEAKELSDIQYYGDEDFIHQYHFSLRLDNVLQITKFDDSKFEDDGYFSPDRTDHKWYLHEKYLDANEECAKAFEAIRPSEKNPIKPGFKLDILQPHELYNFHMIGRHIQGFFNVWSEVGREWQRPDGQWVSRRYLVDMYNRFMFPLYIDFPYWRAEMQFSFDRYTMYGLKLMKFIKRHSKALKEMGDILFARYPSDIRNTSITTLTLAKHRKAYCDQVHAENKKMFSYGYKPEKRQVRKSKNAERGETNAHQLPRNQASPRKPLKEPRFSAPRMYPLHRPQQPIQKENVEMRSSKSSTSLDLVPYNTKPTPQSIQQREQAIPVRTQPDSQGTHNPRAAVLPPHRVSILKKPTLPTQKTVSIPQRPPLPPQQTALPQQSVQSGPLTSPSASETTLTNSKTSPTASLKRQQPEREATTTKETLPAPLSKKRCSTTSNGSGDSHPSTGEEHVDEPNSEGSSSVWVPSEEGLQPEEYAKKILDHFSEPYHYQDLKSETPRKRKASVKSTSSSIELGASTSSSLPNDSSPTTNSAESLASPKPSAMQTVPQTYVSLGESSPKKARLSPKPTPPVGPVYPVKTMAAVVPTLSTVQFPTARVPQTTAVDNRNRQQGTPYYPAAMRLRTTQHQAGSVSVSYIAHLTQTRPIGAIPVEGDPVFSYPKERKHKSWKTKAQSQPLPNQFIADGHCSRSIEINMQMNLHDDYVRRQKHNRGISVRYVSQWHPPARRLVQQTGLLTPSIAQGPVTHNLVGLSRGVSNLSQQNSRPVPSSSNANLRAAMPANHIQENGLVPYNRGNTNTTRNAMELVRPANNRQLPMKPTVLPSAPLMPMNPSSSRAASNTNNLATVQRLTETLQKLDPKLTPEEIAHAYRFDTKKKRVNGDEGPDVRTFFNNLKK